MTVAIVAAEGLDCRAAAEVFSALTNEVMALAWLRKSLFAELTSAVAAVPIFWACDFRHCPATDRQAAQPVHGVLKVASVRRVSSLLLQQSASCCCSSRRAQLPRSRRHRPDCLDASRDMARAHWGVRRQPPGMGWCDLCRDRLGARRATLAGHADQDGPIGLRPVRAKQSSSSLSVSCSRAAASSPPYGRRCAMASPALTRRHSHGSWRLRGRGQALGVQAEAAAVGRVIMSQRTVISRAGREGRRVLPG